MGKTLAASKSSEVTSSPDVPVTNPNGVTAVYSNNFGVNATLTDFTIFFLELGQTPGPEGNIQKHELKSIVTLPFPAATGLIDVLQQLLKRQSDLAQSTVKMGKRVQ